MHDFDAVLTRLAKLEDENRHLKRRIRYACCLSVIVVLLGALGIMMNPGFPTAHAQPGEKIPKAITAEKFAVLDSKGNLRLFMGPNKKGEPVIGLLDSAGKNRLELSVANDEPSIQLYDEDDRGRLRLTLLNKTNPSVLFFDKKKARLGLGVDDEKVGIEMFGAESERQMTLYAQNEGTYLSMYDSSNKGRLAMLIDKDQPSLYFVDSQQKERMKLYSNKDSTGLSLTDGNSKPRVGLMMMTNSGDVGLGLFGGDGKVLFFQPEKK